VLMTKSLRDQAVTAAAWAIRKPRSLDERGVDSTIYADTEASRLYQDDADGSRVSCVAIAQTERPASNYHFVSQNERSRIRSTVLKPVYSLGSQLLGFVVAHANQPEVFAEDDEDFWDELLEPLAAEVGLLVQRIQQEVDDGVAPPW